MLILMIKIKLSFTSIAKELIAILNGQSNIVFIFMLFKNVGTRISRVYT